MSNYNTLVHLAESYATDFRDDDFQHQVVAVCIKNGKPIAFGVNQKRHLKNRSTFKCSCHAEMDLLRKIGGKAKGSKIYLYRFNNTENPTARENKNGKPCIMCQHVLKSVGVSKIFYVDDDSNIQILKNRDMVSLIGSPATITRFFVDRDKDANNAKFIPMDYVRTV